MDNGELYDILVRIHKRVKDGFKPMSDKDQYGVSEKWMMPKDVDNVTGDCEDFALACRVLCREKGIKSRLVLCYTETNQGHCVLECNGYILDNRQKTVIRRDDLEYRWISISGYNLGDEWHKII